MQFDSRTPLESGYTREKVLLQLTNSHFAITSLHRLLGFLGQKYLPSCILSEECKSFIDISV
jgi:hypothetical protein